jgi:hypothetical protein
MANEMFINRFEELHPSSVPMDRRVEYMDAGERRAYTDVLLGVIDADLEAIASLYKEHLDSVHGFRVSVLTQGIPGMAAYWEPFLTSVSAFTDTGSRGILRPLAFWYMMGWVRGIRRYLDEVKRREKEAYLAANPPPPIRYYRK